jgi:hypothetical protein
MGGVKSKCEIALILISSGILTDGTDNGSPAIILGRGILSIELCEPLNSSSARVQMIQSVGHVWNWAYR